MAPTCRVYAASLLHAPGRFGERRIVRPVAAIAAASIALAGEKRRPIASMSWLRWTTRMASGWLRLCMSGEAVAVPALEGEAQRVANRGAEVEPLRKHVGNFAAGLEVVHRPRVRGLLNHLDDLLALFIGAAGRGEGHHVVHYLSRVGGVVDQRLGADGDLVAEDGSHFVGVTGAPDVAQQGDPIDGVAGFVESRGLGDPVASRQERSCDSSGWPKALSCARAKVATNSPNRSGLVKIGNSPDAGPEWMGHHG